MRAQRHSISFTALIVALGGFLMGFDTSVISGVVGFIEVEFALSSLQLGWSVSSLTLASTVAMFVAGPLSDRMGRKPVLKLAALLFAASAVASAFAANFWMLVMARMLGGLGVGASLIIAPMYIAEMAPPKSRGRLVSFNQLNIVIGISVAFFSNYLILTLGEAGSGFAAVLGLQDYAWRWMLGIELLPAALYFVALFRVPESPRWLLMQGRTAEASAVLQSLGGDDAGEEALARLRRGLSSDSSSPSVSWRELFKPSMRLVITLGVTIGILQQITGINAVFYYAPMIFEQSGIGTNSAFMQAVLVGITNVVFTVVALLLIDFLGRRILLSAGLSGIALSMLILAYGFSTATYQLDHSAIARLPAELDQRTLAGLTDNSYFSDLEFREAMSSAIGMQQFTAYQAQLTANAIKLNSTLILAAILAFVASFAVSIGPVMWVLFSEMFPNRLRGKAVSFAGLINSSIAFLVTLLFPWELETFGIATTFLIYGLFAVCGVVFVIRLMPETKGKSLEQLQHDLVKN